MPRRRAGRKRRLDVARKPSGAPRTSTYDERLGPTPEMAARLEAAFGAPRARGDVHDPIAIMAAATGERPALITEEQAAAAHKFRRQYVMVNGDPRAPAQSLERRPGQGMTQARLAVVTAEYREAHASLQRVSRLALQQVHDVAVCGHRPMLAWLDQLRLGLSELAAHYRGAGGIARRHCPLTSALIMDTSQGDGPSE